MLIPFRDQNPSRRRPFVTYGLIATNVLVFLAYWPLFNDSAAIHRFFVDWALIPAAVLNGHLLFGIVTSMFLHGGIAHIFFNMLALHIFGDNLEETLGHIPFLLFYLACGVASAITHAAMNPYSIVPTVGASGAIAGIMGGYLLLFPKARIDMFLFLVIIFRVFSLSAWVVLGGWLLIQLYGAAANGASSGVAYWAHISGFAVGAALIFPTWLRRGGTRYWRNSHGRPNNPKSKPTINIPVVRRNR